MSTRRGFRRRCLDPAVTISASSACGSSTRSSNRNPEMSAVRAVGVFAIAALLIGGGSARAEIVLLTTGRTLSVKAHRLEDDKVTLVLRAGGELTCPASLVVRIDPDEVPYPDNPVPAAG